MRIRHHKRLLDIISITTDCVDPSDDRREGADLAAEGGLLSGPPLAFFTDILKKKKGGDK